MRRATAACIRCHDRKQRCSGDHPCVQCVKNDATCEYRVKAKPIKITDVEYERLVRERDRYHHEVKLLRRLLGKYNVDESPESEWTHNSSKTEPLKLLECALAEVICEQLDAWVNLGKDLSPLSFSWAYEEKVYDWVFETKPLYNPIDSLSMEKMYLSYRNVTTFIRLGYLTVEPSFLDRCCQYFEGQTMPVKFTYKMLMMQALGEVYDQLMDVLLITTQVTHLPGLTCFQFVLGNFQGLNSMIKADHNDTIDTIELFGIMAIYLRILDKKCAAYLFTNNALQLAVSLELHTSNNFEHQATWWSTYCLNRFLAIRIGKPLLVFPIESTCKLPPDPGLAAQVQLAHILERICRQLFGNDSNMSDIHPRANNNYKLVAQIMHSLIDWHDSLPPYLQLSVSSDQEVVEPADRVIYSLHLNYLHHIYLALIPILMKYAEVQLLTFHKEKKVLQAANLMSKNIRNLVEKLIDSCQLTLNIFIQVYRAKVFRLFGFTDLDHMLATNVSFLIAMMLDIRTSRINSIEDNLKVGLHFMNELASKGNKVWGRKLSHLLKAVKDFKPILQKLNYGGFVAFCEETNWLVTPGLANYDHHQDIDDFAVPDLEDFSWTMMDLQALDEFWDDTSYGSGSTQDTLPINFSS